MKTHIYDVVRCINRFKNLSDKLQERYQITKEDCYKYSWYQEALLAIKHEYTANLLLSVLKAENEDREGLYNFLYEYLSVDNTTDDYYLDVNDTKGNLEYAYTLAEMSCYLDYLKTGQFNGPTLDISTLGVLDKAKDDYKIDKLAVFKHKMEITNSDEDLQAVATFTKMSSKLLAFELVALYKILGKKETERAGD